MGIARGAPGTVVGVMVDAPEPDAGDATDRPGASDAPRPAARKLDRRTIAICALIGLVAALVTALVASALLSDDSSGSDLELEEARGANTERLLAQPVDTVDGGTSDLAAYAADQPMLINIWASNCVPCIDEMPLLEQARADNPGVTFVGVASQDDPAKAAALAKQTGITYPYVLDPTGEVAYEADGTSMPTTVLLNAEGDLVAARSGAFHTQDDLQSFVDQAG